MASLILLGTLSMFPYNAESCVAGRSRTGQVPCKHLRFSPHHDLNTRRIHARCTAGCWGSLYAVRCPVWQSREIGFCMKNWEAFAAARFENDGSPGPRPTAAGNYTSRRHETKSRRVERGEGEGWKCASRCRRLLYRINFQGEGAVCL